MNRRFVNAVLVMCVLAGEADAARPYRGGAVATAHPQATEAGLEMLAHGGNAVDAAVAAAFVLAVVGPYHSGLGGGGFALVHDATLGATEVLDFREVAPKGASREMFVEGGKVVPGRSTDGALSVAVPGAVKGYLELLARKGKLRPAQVLAPAIRLAQQGFWVTPKYQAMATPRLACLEKDPEATRLFLRPRKSGGVEVPALGTKIVQPELAQTLTGLARLGAKAFYLGKVAAAIAGTVKAAGGVLTEADLAAYQVRWRQPLEGAYRGYRVLTMPPPSAGGIAVLQVLGALELNGPQGISSHQPEVLHRYVEAVRRAYVDRARYLGDPAFTEVPTAKLTSRDYITELAASIDSSQATPSQSLLPAGQTVAPDGGAKPGKKNTTHISVIDKEGNAVALTTTVNYMFGSCLVAKGTGVLLNDEMDDFAALPLAPNAYGLVTGEANAVAPGKVPLSSMSPTLVFQRDDPSKVLLAVGSPGGSTIPTTVIQVISHVIDGHMDIVRAVGAGRIHHQYLPDAILLDRQALDPLTERALEAKGHKIDHSDGWGDAEAVLVDPVSGLRTAGSDPRNEGAAMGED